MRFNLTLSYKQGDRALPINYQYPISSALYRVIAEGNGEYAAFLHNKGYGKGFKFFTFSDIRCPFEIHGDRLRLKQDEIKIQVCFHIPEAMESFIKGLFQSEQIDIADKKSKASFTVKSVESLPNPIAAKQENEVLQVHLTPFSPIVAGTHNEKGHYDFLAPDDQPFTESLIFNWRSKIEACYDMATANDAFLMMERVEIGAIANNNESETKSQRLNHTRRKSSEPKSRLITIKADTKEETKIRGWMNFGLKVTAERRFLDLLMNSGMGLYNALGMGCVGLVIHDKN